jgi:RNA polymerase sigma-70 factor, ECF subfamily
MSMDHADLLRRALDGDDGAFAGLVSPHERAVFRHCYRMLGSGVDAEEACQDTLVRAWRRLATFDQRGPFAAWLYRIATNVCLDMLRARRARRDPFGEGSPSAGGTMPEEAGADVAVVEPVGNGELGELNPLDDLLRREAVSLAFVAALQRLAPRQRGALLLHDVLGFSLAEVAGVLEASASATNSLLSRARETAQSHPTTEVPDPRDPRVVALLGRYVDAWHLADLPAFLDLVVDDITFSMPPMQTWFAGRAAVGGFVDAAIFAPSRPYGVALVAGWCNGQPAFGVYQPDAAGQLAASGLQVLNLVEEGGEWAIAAIASYRVDGLAERCGLPPTIS